jgi:asparagine synthase (glutamine-hydrolysing)
MLEALYHRGPDSAGEYRSSKDFVAGMRRLSINDLENGDQPLYSEDKNVVLLYNGEIYNYPQLRKTLESKGYHFRTKSDGEVICHMYKEHGVDLFGHLDGMFAIALWVENEQRLVLARDIPGEKPLYYTKLSNTELVFSSEIKSLLKFPGIGRGLNYQSVWDFPTFLWVPEPETIYEEVSALPRGHMLISDPGGTRVVQYENHFIKSTQPLTDEECVDETRAVIEQAVSSRLLSDVPLGCFLSGGLDSSIVAALAAKQFPKLKSFTIGFEDVDDPYHGRADESHLAKEFADALGIENHLTRVTADVFRADLEAFCHFADQPFSVSSGLGILSIARSAKEQGISVLLSGDGADECFGGYSWYSHLAQANELGMDAIARGEQLSSEQDISFQSIGESIEERIRRLAKLDSHTRAWAWHYYASELDKTDLFADSMGSELASSTRHFAAFDPNLSWSEEAYIAQDRSFYFPFEMMRKMDRMTMACSVEGRVPFAAPAVLAHAERLSYQQCVRGGELKWALRNAFSDLLPETVWRRPKHGFNVPIDHWLKGQWNDLLQDSFSSDSALARHGLISANAQSKAQLLLDDPIGLHGHTLFSFIMLNMWLENEHGNHC